jgi:hypothetical protein
MASVYQLVNPRSAHSEMDRIAPICSSEWLGRIWTVQELLLARSSVFVTGKAKYKQSCLFICLYLGANLMDPDKAKVFDIRNSLVERDLRLNTDNTQTALVGQLSKMVLLAFLNNATDARDKVYRMLSFLKNKSTDLDLPEVDYTKSVAQIYQEFTLCMILDTLWPLELIRGSGQPSDLQSWAPNFRDPTLIDLQHTIRPGVYRTLKEPED